MRQLASKAQLRAGCCVAFISLHLVLLLGVSIRDTLWLLAHSRTLFPQLGAELDISAPDRLREMARAYLNAAGIERGYGFFAPNVPASYHLAFEVEFPDGSVTYVSPQFDSAEERLRWASAMDYLGRTTSEEVREVLLKLIAHSVRQQHPEAVKMLAAFSQVRAPTISEFTAGKRPVHQPLYTYRFRFSDTP